jgi:spoIIIJ-associated protein
LSEIDLAQQEAVVGDFLRGLVDAFGVDATVSTAIVADDEAVEAAIDGTELGLLVGPKGLTLQSVQELARSVVQRRMPGERHGRIRIDVAGYRERRREALARFTQQVAQEVLDTGQRKVLEPMAPPDRKVIHDTVNEIDGVATVSEGEEPRRRVVILPAAEA